LPFFVAQSTIGSHSSADGMSRNQPNWAKQSNTKNKSWGSCKDPILSPGRRELAKQVADTMARRLEHPETQRNQLGFGVGNRRGDSIRFLTGNQFPYYRISRQRWWSSGLRADPRRPSIRAIIRGSCRRDWTPSARWTSQIWERCEAHAISQIQRGFEACCAWRKAGAVNASGLRVGICVPRIRLDCEEIAKLLRIKSACEIARHDRQCRSIPNSPGTRSTKEFQPLCTQTCGIAWPVDRTSDPIASCAQEVADPETSRGWTSQSRSRRGAHRRSP